VRSREGRCGGIPRYPRGGRGASMGLRALRHGATDGCRHGGAAIFRPRSARRGARRARRRRLTSSINVASSSWAEFVTHVPGLFCYRCPRPHRRGDHGCCAVGHHSITRSARSRTDWGIVSPSAFAVRWKSLFGSVLVHRHGTRKMGSRRPHRMASNRSATTTTILVPNARERGSPNVCRSR
jgi:hypothetical protein